jgi:hypothetical protein
LDLNEKSIFISVVLLFFSVELSLDLDVAVHGYVILVVFVFSQQVAAFLHQFLSLVFDLLLVFLLVSS